MAIRPKRSRMKSVRYIRKPAPTIDAIATMPAIHRNVLITSGESMRSNIVISRSFSAYFLRFPLISAANAEEESAFFGGSCGQNRRFPKGRKAIFRLGTAAAQVARSRPRCPAGKSLFGADGRGVRGLD